MKRVFLIIGLALLALNSFGQNKTTEFGIKGGLNYSSFIDNNDNFAPIDYKAKVGFYIGTFFSLMVNERLSIRPESIYSWQASYFSINNGSVDGNIKESILAIPIILEYKLNENFNLGIGPQLGYSLNRRIEYDNNPFGSGFIINDDSDNFEIGIKLELGYSITANYGVSLSYNYGITERQNLNTSVIQLGMNYRL